MSFLDLHPVKTLVGDLKVPGDKSISHRAVIFGALARGETLVRDPLASEDVLSTRSCFEEMGVPMDLSEGLWRIRGLGLHGLKAPTKDLDCRNSGTTMRLLAGVLAGQKFSSRLVGDSSLSQRPMGRVVEPLKKMGAQITALEGRAPLCIQGHSLSAIHYDLPVASAQVKSALLLAGLYAKGRTRLTGLIQSRDHSERMLQAFGVKVESSETEILLEGGQTLEATEVRVPGDISSAAFFLVAGAIVPGSRVKVEGVCLNPTRDGILRVLKRMGAEISIEVTSESPEPTGNVTIQYSKLKGTSIGPPEMPLLVDEIPVIAVLAAHAHGRTEVSGAEELRVKESDRLRALLRGLRAFGVEVTEKEDGFVLDGPQKFKGGAEIQTESDHRIAMAFSVAALRAEGTTRIDDPKCVAISFPNFYEILRDLRHGQ